MSQKAALHSASRRSGPAAVVKQERADILQRLHAVKGEERPAAAILAMSLKAAAEGQEMTPAVIEAAAAYPWQALDLPEEVGRPSQ